SDLIFLIVLGFYMANTESYGFYSLHKSLGVCALAAALIRLVWRWVYPWQSSALGTAQEQLVKWAHRLLLFLLLLMPLTGMSLSGFGGHGVYLFGLQIIPSQYNTEGEAIPFNAELSELGYIAHEGIAYLFTALLLLHIGAALKHHFL